MLNLFQSNDIHELVKELANDIKKNNEGKLFDSPIHRIIIPSLINKSWLNFELEKELGVLFRIEYDNLNWCPYRIAKEIGIKHLNQTATRKDLFFEIVSILSSNIKPEGKISLLDRPEMSLVRNYINDKFERVATEKTFQLAGKLADVFLKYIDYNVDGNIETDIISKWNNMITNSKNDEFDFSEMGEVEICEFLIYNELVNIKNTKSEITRRTILKEFDFSDAKPTEKIKLYIFNYPFISQGNMGTLSRLSKYIDTKIYYNPIYSKLPICEDQKFDNILKPSIQKKYEFNLSLNINSEDTKERNIVKESKSILDCLKYGSIERISQDTSIQVLACPGIYREVECVYNSIIDNLNRGSNLKPEDIGVILTDTNKYFPAVNGIFGMNSDKIPFNLICGMPNAVNDYIEGIKKLAYLSEELFTKESVQALFENPCFRNKFNISHKEVENFMDYAQKENIWAFFNGNSKNDFFHRKEHLSEQYTWNWSGANLRLGSIMDLEEEHNKWTYYIPKNAIGDFEIFFNILTKIYYELNYYKSIDINVKSEHIIKYFQDFVKSFLKPERENDSVKILIDKSIEDFIYQSVARNYIPTFNEVYEYINMVASSSNYTKGRAFTGGVVVGKLFNMRVCNFKILYVLGLNEGVFPKQDNKSSLDLTLNFPQRITGEEEEKYALYKLITSTEEKVYLSYSNKDLEKDAILYKSGAIDELIEYINKNITKEKFVEINMPLFGRSSSYYYNKDNKYKSYSDAFINYSKNDMDLAKIEYDQEYYNIEKEHVAEGEFIKNLDIDSDIPMKLSVKNIVDFLMNPIEYVLKHHGIKDKFENEKDYIYEPVSIKNFEYNNIINQCVFEVFNIIKENHNNDLDSIKKSALDKVINIYDNNGIIPQNPVGDNIKKLIKDDYFDLVNKFSIGEGDFETNVLIGYPANIHEKYNKSYSPVQINYRKDFKDLFKKENIIDECDELKVNIDDYFEELKINNIELEATNENINNSKEIELKRSTFPYGIRDVELSCLIPIINNQNEIYLFKYGNYKPKYEFEAKLMLLVYILATGKINSKIQYICEKTYIYEYKPKFMEGVEVIDNEIPENIIEKNLQLIRKNLFELFIYMQSITSLYEYLPFDEKATSNEEYISSATNFGPFSSYKHYLIENLPNIFEINKDNPLDRIKDRISLINNLFEEEKK